MWAFVGRVWFQGEVCLAKVASRMRVRLIARGRGGPRIDSPGLSRASFGRVFSERPSYVHASSHGRRMKRYVSRLSPPALGSKRIIHQPTV